jgi:hypothetical protein
MLMRLFANCLCGFSICVILWGVSPVLADGSPCMVLLCNSGDGTCAAVQGDNGCLSTPVCYGFFGGECKCKTVTGGASSLCACRNK